MTDLISRRAAIKAIDDLPNCYNGYSETYDKAYIIGTLEELPSAEKHVEWIPITTRPMDEEERKEWSEKLGYDIEYEDAVIYDSQLPDDGQEVLVCSMYGRMFVDKFENDPDYGCSFEENGDMDGIVAWMPLPEPYREDAAE